MRYGSNDGMENLTRTIEKNAEDAAIKANTLFPINVLSLLEELINS